jgi:hypothetical protein
VVGSSDGVIVRAGTEKGLAGMDLDCLGGLRALFQELDEGGFEEFDGRSLTLAGPPTPWPARIGACLASLTRAVPRN